MQTLCIENDMTIYTAAEQRQILVAFLECGADLEINLAQVNEIDTAGLQLLILSKHEAAQAQKTLRFVMHSAAVTDILELTNLTGVLGDPLLLVSNSGEHACT